VNQVMKTRLTRPLALITLAAASTAGPAATATPGPAAASTPGPAAAAPEQNDGLAGTWPYDRGLYTAFCPRGHDRVRELEAVEEAEPEGRAASTSEAGWPPKECLKMDKGRAGVRHTIVGLNGVHNWLLGGYGNDTIIGGDRGDVIWGDYHPSGEQMQTATIHAGNGRNVIYANDTRDYVWTGSNPFTVVHAHDSGISGVIHCQARHIVVYLSMASERHFKLDGCARISHYSVGY
jgi:RTX calcium-binding nonapeptide repeat (4 copies)